jgi:predicted secreted protein
MASGAKIGRGAELKRGDGGSPETFVKIAEVKGVAGPGGARDILDVTNMDSVGSFREYIAGLGDPGEVTFSVNYIPSEVTHGYLLDDFNLSTIRNWQLAWPQFAGAPYLSFEAIVTSFGSDTPIDSPVLANVTLKVTGQVTLVP